MRAGKMQKFGRDGWFWALHSGILWTNPPQWDSMNESSTVVRSEGTLALVMTVWHWLDKQQVWHLYNYIDVERNMPGPGHWWWLLQWPCCFIYILSGSNISSRTFIRQKHLSLHLQWEPMAWLTCLVSWVTEDITTAVRESGEEKSWNSVIPN